MNLFGQKGISIILVPESSELSVSVLYRVCFYMILYHKWYVTPILEQAFKESHSWQYFVIKVEEYIILRVEGGESQSMT